MRWMKLPQFGAQADVQGGMPPEHQSRIIPPVNGRGKGLQVVRLREIVMILELKRQGLGASAIARQTGLDRKTGFCRKFSTWLSGRLTLDRLMLRAERIAEMRSSHWRGIGPYGC